MNTKFQDYRYKNLLSGKYKFVGVTNDTNRYMQESSDCDCCRFYLTYRNRYWFFTTKKYAVENNNDNRFKGLLRAKTSGM